MRIALIIAGNIWNSPYIKIYEKVLNDKHVEYDIISWNRDGNDPKCGYQFESKISNANSRYKKFYPYVKYAKFVKNILRKNAYDKLIVFGPHIGILLLNYLIKNYSKNFILDYRDLSIEQKIFFKYLFKKLLLNSYAIFVSSPGFIRCLPKGFDYKLSHNFDIDVVKKALSRKDIVPFNTKVFNVLTIGGIRDYSSNIQVVNALANKPGFALQFVGKGSAAKSIEDYANRYNVKNIEFGGYYEKRDEHLFVEPASLLNIFYPKIISHSTAVSNRFYNALIYKKPMIVTSSSTQGDYVEKYNLGLSLESCDNLDRKIIAFFADNNEQLFNERCNDLLKEFIKDYDSFYKVVSDFCSKN